MHYRAEIDGLRAVAVIPVVFFHAGFPSFSGGFIGVDVFFVISGYLITSIILSDLEKDRFSLLHFYERRARRILPALFLVMAACIPFAWMWLLPHAMNDFVQSVIAVTTFWSNILFWQESNYFATAADLKPLLHTWSLAVEEQYYLLFPLTMMLFWRFGRQKLLALLAIAFVLSLGLAHWGTYNRPSAAFYLLPTRGWELLLGAFAAFYLSRNKSVPISKTQSEAVCLIGVALIAYSIVAFDKSTPFPGLHALVPTVGTLLIILCAQNQTFVQRLLSQKLLVGIGLISYSAYLWHQPLLAFAKHRSITEPSMLMMGVLCVLTFPLAYLSWRFVEVPARNRQLFSRNVVFGSAAVASAAFLTFGITTYSSDTFEVRWLARQSVEVQQTYKLVNIDSANANLGVDENGNQDDGICRFNVRNLTAEVADRLVACSTRFGPGIAILGDSHAVDLFGVVTSRRSDDFVVGITRPGCRPDSDLPQCHYTEFSQFIQTNPGVFSSVIYEQAAIFLLRTEHERGTREMFNRLALDEPIPEVFIDEEVVAGAYEYLSNIANIVPVLWFGPRIEPHITRKMILRLGCGHDFQLRPGHREIFDQIDDYLAKITSTNEQITFLSQNEVFDFEFPSDFMSCNQIFWSDGDHYSADGEKRFGARFDLIEHMKDNGIVNFTVGHHDSTGQRQDSTAVKNVDTLQFREEVNDLQRRE